jgi:hypothetical protein
MEKTYFDGTAFEDMGIVVERVRDELPESNAVTVDRPGSHGTGVVSLKLAEREIVLECRAFEKAWQGFDDLMSAVAALVVTPDERKLQPRNRHGQYYMAHYTSIAEGDRVGLTGIGGFELTFTASDPCRFGEERSLVVRPSDGTVRFEVGGTDRADMSVSVKGAVRSGETWQLMLNGNPIKVPLASGSHDISIDFTGHKVEVDGEPSGVTLDTDWPRIEPGRWRASVPTGTATVSWTQRYR